MNNNSTGKMLFGALKAFVIVTLKLAFVILAWILKIVGLLCNKISEAIQTIINRRL